MSSYKTLKVDASFHTRLYITDCSGIAITQSDVSSVQFQVFHRTYDTREVVPGYSLTDAGIESILDAPVTDAHTGKYVNFEHTINPIGGFVPFPDYGQLYIIQYRFTDQTGAVSIFEIEGVTQK